MTRFAYRAVAARGELLEGELSAESRERAIGLLRRRNAVPLSVRPLDGGRSWLPRLDGGSAAGELAGFTRELEVLLGAGVTVARALAIVAESGAAGASRTLAGDLLGRVRGGASLGAAMQAHPEFFPGYYVGMVRAGEEGGTLAAVLARLAAMIERQAALRAKVRSALAYPLLVLALSGLTMAVLLVWVIPEFRPLFEQGDVAPPLSARLVFALSDGVEAFGRPLALALLAGLLVLHWLGRRATGARPGERLVLRLPLVGPLVRKIETARFCRTLGTLVLNGVPVLDSVKVATGTIANRELAAAAGAMAAALARGDDVVAATARVGWLSARVRHLVAVGTESGRLGEMLIRVAEMHEAESERAVDRLVGLIGPAMTVLLGGVIGFMIWSILGAVLGSYELAA